MKDLEQKISELQEQLRQQQKMASLGMLTAGIAHEVQNPLNFVINFSKLSARLLSELNEVLDEVSDSLDEDQRQDIEDIAADLTENMQKIQEHGERAISVIRNILLQSRGKDGERLPTSLPQLVHEYVWLSYHAMRASDSSFNISIREDYDNTMPDYSVVPQDISRAVLNLVNNACYAVHERAVQLGAHDDSDDSYVPTITVTVKQQDDNAVITIADNGTGISDEVRQQLFKKIVTTKPIGKGTGLGLSITHKIVVEDHKGQLLVDSQVGEGSTFTIIIPKA